MKRGSKKFSNFRDYVFMVKVFKAENCAKIWGVTRPTAYSYVKDPYKTLTLWHIDKLARHMGVPPDDLTFLIKLSHKTRKEMSIAEFKRWVKLDRTPLAKRAE
tara:strand:- start:812 stop:1120 length:309 start_codon:yes stop_codon:yes gene_type:complete